MLLLQHISIVCWWRLFQGSSVMVHEYCTGHFLTSLNSCPSDSSAPVESKLQLVWLIFWWLFLVLQCITSMPKWQSSKPTLPSAITVIEIRGTPITDHDHQYEHPLLRIFIFGFCLFFCFCCYCWCCLLLFLAVMADSGQISSTLRHIFKLSLMSIILCSRLIKT